MFLRKCQVFQTIFKLKMSVKTILYKSKTLKNGEHPIMLYIYEDRKYYLSLNYSATEKQWDASKCRFRKNVENYKVKNLNIRKYELKAMEIVDDFVRQGRRFDFKIFKDRFKGISSELTFYTFFEKFVEEKKALQKLGTAYTYTCALKALRRYKRTDTTFSEITYSFLKGFETYLFQTGCKEGGIANYMRSTRVVYYEGIRRGFIEKERNPFSTTMNKEGYSLAKLKTKKNSKALNKQEIEALKNFDIDANPKFGRAWRLFMFSFRMFGMNFIDICNLRKENIVNGRIVYQRQKTGKSFNLKISEQAQEIINYFENSASEYVFPVFNENIHKTPMQKKNRHRRVLKETNRDMRALAEQLDIKTPITFYVARHTSATTLKRNGVATDIISEALGHSDIQVTQHYLKNFDTEVLDLAMDSL